MQKTYKAVIVGGGAAGLLCAVELLSGSDALSGEDVLILERNDRVGKKLIATGNGQGNLTNDNFDKRFYYGDKKFIDAFASQTKAINIKKYFYDLGIPLTSGKDGKVYPLSKQASAVLDVLRAFLSYKKCEILTDSKVTSIVRDEKGYFVKTDKAKYYAKSVVVATGGAAAKQFGTDGTSYALVEKLGHKKTELFPSLVQLKTQTDAIKGLKGLKEVASVTAFHNEKPLMSVTGDLLFTEYGVSGSTIFQISACIAGKKDAYLIVEFLPELTYSETEELLKNKRAKPFIKEEDLLCGVVNKKIGQAIIKSAKSNKTEDLAFAIKNFKLKITGSLDFNFAQVTKGGIKTDTINPTTFESQIAKNLYLVGELLNVDGDCGGYNLTFAFASGILAGRAIKKIN